ncbi:quinolinate synthase NadA [bacterium]|nr:quinolinate synthase NadA [bacterium]
MESLLELDFSRSEIDAETERLLSRLDAVHWNKDTCAIIAPITLEINRLKKEMNAIILAHSYQTADIIFGIADFAGDSLGLSREAANTDADTIIFCGVRFMAETAKILSPEKTILLPAPNAGCSLAESITAADVRKLKEDNPGVPVVCYVNTNADVKAESHACCTSGNAAEVVNAQPGDKVIFIPDMLMAKNLEAHVDKEIIAWDGTCIVHEEFSPGSIEAWRKFHPDLKVLAHLECDSDVVDISDMAGSTEGMVKYIKQSDATHFMLVTECGMSDRLRVEMGKDREFLGSCVLCPYMKQVELPIVLECMKSPREDQIVTLDEDIIRRAKTAIDQMMAH